MPYRGEAHRRKDYQVIDVAQCSWSLDDDMNDKDEKCRVLSVSLVKPPLPQDDILYKKGLQGELRSRSDILREIRA